MTHSDSSNDDVATNDRGTDSAVFLHCVFGISNTSAARSQISLTEDAAADSQHFPDGRLDRDDQQIDLRSQNSWTMQIGQISTVEMLECHVINAFAPWVLISELKSLMEATGNPVIFETSATASDVSEDTSIKSSCDKYIVNVSAMEGQFYRPKTVSSTQ
ncbi:hypothetical protein QVD99_003774 [Batrachochytrium dendrobatidis]|nr:hypothetical protein QVD99_003774 [Batrachochytrium dendrobatidis]